MFNFTCKECDYEEAEGFIIDSIGDEVHYEIDCDWCGSNYTEWREV